MIGVLIAIGVVAVVSFGFALHAAWTSTRPDVLLAIARPAGTPEHVESQLTAKLIAGALDAEEYRRALAGLAQADAPLAVSR